MIDGQPISTGSIGFKPVGGGRIGGGRIEPDGSFFISMYEKGDGLTTGSYTVAVSALEPVSNTSQRWYAPKKYADHKTSELVVEITKPTSDLNLELTWEGDDHDQPWVENL
ncbi:hypothetical protein [Pirellulimonas nuda]|nr:hypothetical protein [Pirellulimonas nuda]